MCNPNKIMYNLDYPFEDPKEGADLGTAGEEWSGVT
jgi:hypothetical protein